MKIHQFQIRCKCTAWPTLCSSESPRCSCRWSATGRAMANGEGFVDLAMKNKGVQHVSITKPLCEIVVSQICPQNDFIMFYHPISDWSWTMGLHQSLGGFEGVLWEKQPTYDYDPTWHSYLSDGLEPQSSQSRWAPDVAGPTRIGHGPSWEKRVLGHRRVSSQAPGAGGQVWLPKSYVTTIFRHLQEQID